VGQGLPRPRGQHAERAETDPPPPGRGKGADEAPEGPARALRILESLQEVLG